MELAAAIKRKVGIPVGVAGRINDPAVAAEILNDGKADFISMGRGLLADPQFPKNYGRAPKRNPAMHSLHGMYEPRAQGGKAIRTVRH